MLILYLLSALQIVLESLPVSSSGHLILLVKLSQLFCGDMCFLSDVINSFKFKFWIHFIHAPTALVVVLFFFSHWIFLVMNPRRTWKIILKLGVLTCLADVITAVFYLFFHLFEVTIPLSLGFVITAFILGSLQWSQCSKPRQLSLGTAIILGIVQGCALLPGISRFAAVFSTACWLGFSTRRAFEITWLVQWPLIVAASLRSVHYFMSQPSRAPAITFDLILVLVGATIVAYYALALVAFLIERNRLWWFCLYMIVPIMLSLLVA